MYGPESTTPRRTRPPASVTELVIPVVPRGQAFHHRQGKSLPAARPPPGTRRTPERARAPTSAQALTARQPEGFPLALTAPGAPRDELWGRSCRQHQNWQSSAESRSSPRRILGRPAVSNAPHGLDGPHPARLPQSLLRMRLTCSRTCGRISRGVPAPYALGDRLSGRTPARGACSAGLTNPT